MQQFQINLQREALAAGSLRVPAEERDWMAAVAPSCRLAKMASERAKLCVSGPQILPKSGPGIVAGKWARNRDRTPGCCLKI